MLYREYREHCCLTKYKIYKYPIKMQVPNNFYFLGLNYQVQQHPYLFHWLRPISAYSPRFRKIKTYILKLVLKLISISR